MKNYYPEVLHYIDDIEIIDTHEHIESIERRKSRSADVFNTLFGQYITDDLVSSGMPAGQLEIVLDERTLLSEKWTVLSRYIDNVRHTGYFTCIRHVLEDLFQIDMLDEQWYAAADNKLERADIGSLYKNIFKSSKIKYCVWDNLFPEFGVPEDSFQTAYRVDELVLIHCKGDIEALEQKYNTALDSLSKFMDFIDRRILDAKKAGCVSFKIATAYYRTLLFEKQDANEAEHALALILKGRADSGAVKVFQDTLMYQVLRSIEKEDMPVQIHTGLQSGNGNLLENANPSLLSGLFLDFPKVRFDVFHAGYPFGGEVSALAKIFPNVYADMCWTHVISPSYSKRCLEEWIDTIPINKIFGFGGDYIFIELVYGHSKMARANIAAVLAKKIESGDMSLRQAKDAASKMLYKNPADFFRVG